MLRRIIIAVFLLLITSGNAHALRFDLSTSVQDHMTRTSSMPVTVVEFAFENTSTAFLSDHPVQTHTVTCGHCHTYTGLVKSWGHIYPTDKRGPFGPMGSEMDMEVVNAGTVPFSKYFDRNTPQNTLVTLYHAFEDAVDSVTPQMEIEQFYIGSVQYDELTCKLHLISAFTKEDKPLGRIINRTDFPKAAYDCVGRDLGYVYGTVNSVPLFPIQVGWQSALVEDIDATTTGNIYMRTDGEAGKVTDLPAAGHVYIGQESVAYTSRTFRDYTSSTDTHNNYITVPSTGRASNARPYQAGTVAFQQMTGYQYGFPYHASKAVRNVKVNGIPQTTGYTVFLNNSTILPGQHLTTVKFNKHPRQIKGVGAHSHVARREVRRSGSSGVANTSGVYTSTANVPTNVGTAQNGYINIKMHAANIVYSSGSSSIIKAQVSGGHVPTESVYSDYFSSALPPAFEITVPLTSLDWSSDMFQVTVTFSSVYGNINIASSQFVVDSAEWVVNYTGGDSVNAEDKQRIEVSGNAGTVATGSNITNAATPPTLIAAPQEIYVLLKMRVVEISFGGSVGTPYTSGALYTITGNHLATSPTYIYSPYYSGVGGGVYSGGESGKMSVLLKMTSPDLSADCFSINIASSIQGSTYGGVTTSVDEVTWIVEYPQGDEEVISGMETISSGPQVVADIDGVCFDNKTVLNTCDSITNVATSDSIGFALSSDTGTKYEGTASWKAIGSTGLLASVDTAYDTRPLAKALTSDNYKHGQVGIDIPNGTILKSIQMRLAKTGTPTGNLWVEVRKGQASGLPTGTLIGQTDNYDVSTLSTSNPPPFVTLNFSTPLNVGTLDGYGIDLVINGYWGTYPPDTTSTSNYIRTTSSSSDVYSGISSCRVSSERGYNYASADGITGAIHNRYSASEHSHAQRHITVASNSNIGKISVRLNRVGTPTGNMWIQVRKGVVGGTPTGTILGVSDNVSVASISNAGTYPFQDFTFTTPLNVGTLDYGIDIVLLGDWTVSTSNYIASINTGSDVYGGTDSCSLTANDAFTWTASTSLDMNFKVYAPLTEETWTKTTNRDLDFKVYADDALNDTITDTITSTDMSKKTSIQFWVRSDRTGGYMSFGLGESAVTDNLYPFTISAANTWEQKTIDISALGATSRDAITKIGFKCTNISTGFTARFDYINSWDNRLKLNPADIMDDVATIRCGLTSDSTTFASAWSDFDTASYEFNGLVRGYPMMSDVLADMQQQSRSAAWVSRGTLKLKYMPDTLTSVKTIPKSQIMQWLTVDDGPIGEVFNTYEVRYEINPRNDTWQGHIHLADATSVTRYGERMIPLNMTYVTDATMADSVGDFWLAWTKDRRKRVSFGVLLDNLDLEQYDEIALTHNATAIGLAASKVFLIDTPPAYTPGYTGYDQQGERYNFSYQSRITAH